MKETQGALSMLLRRYRLILGKCRWKNLLAGLVLGAVLATPAVSLADSGGKPGRPGYPGEDRFYTGTVDGASGEYVGSKGNIVIENRNSDYNHKEYYGGYVDGEGDVTGNTVTMRGADPRAKNIYGGWTDKGEAAGNVVTLENGRVGSLWAQGRVYAGGTGDGDATGNTLEIRSGHIEGSHTDVIAGYTAKGDSTDNKLSISGGRIDRTAADHFVSGGRSEEGSARNNTLTVTGGELGQEAYGGHAQTGAAEGNRVEFSGAGSSVGKLTAGHTVQGEARGNSLVMGGGTVKTFLIGGESVSGLVSGNKIEMHGGTVGKSVYAGYTNGGGASGNELVVDGGTISGNAFGSFIDAGSTQDTRGNKVSFGGTASVGNLIGGFSENGGATGNTVTVSGGTLARIRGGESVGNTVSGNTVLVTGGTIGTSDDDGQICGGYTVTGAAENNSVTIEGGTIATNAQGGYVDSGTGAASGNTVRISGGSVGKYLYGGHTVGGLASGNKIEMHGGEVGKHIYAGYSDKGGASGNELVVDGGTISGNAFGSFIDAGSTQDTRGNKVSFGGTASVGNLIGGFSENGGATGNTVTVSGGTLARIRGGESVGNTVSGNTVLVTGGTIGTSDDDGQICGGYTVTGTAENNSVTIEGGAISLNVKGGHVDSGTGAASGNTVRIGGGSVGKYVYGGYTDQGDASGNTVTISGGTPGVAVYGGFVQTGAGRATGNTLILEGSPNLRGTALYGGGTESGTGDMVSGNTLEVRTSGLTAANVGRFARYHFILPEGTRAGSTVLTLTDGKGTDISNSSVGVAVAGGTPLLRKGDSVTLLSNEHGLNAEGMTHERLSARQGVFVEYDFDLKTTDTSLLATVADDKLPDAREGGRTGGTAGRLAPQAKAPLEGVLANVALGNIGADLVAGQGIDRARAAAAMSGEGPAWGIAPFAAVSGTRSRYQTGSHMDLSGVSFMTGFAKRVETPMMDILAGVFFEAGFARVDTHNSFSDGPSVDGEGRSSYYGGGLLARLDLSRDLLKGLYLEGSFRYGRINSHWQSDDLHDAVSGRKADYDLSTPYYGLHAGLGYLWELSDSLTLDLYGKYFWTRTQGQSTHIVDDPWSFKDVDSQRLRLGARLGYDFCRQVTGYAGAAWEREFGGKARATAYGLDAPSPSLKGDSGLLEAGLTLKPVADSGLSLDFGVQGHTGVRQGVSGTAQVRYEF